MKNHFIILSFFMLLHSQPAFSSDAHTGFVPLEPYSIAPYNATQAKCISASINAGKKIGMQNMKATGTNGLYTYGKNQNGYSVQFLCIKNKNIAFIVINGESFPERQRIYKEFDFHFKKSLQN